MKTTGDFCVAAFFLSPFVIGALVAALVVGGQRRWIMRGNKSAIPMDGATLLEADNGDIVLKRRAIINLIYLALLGLWVVGVFAFLVVPIFTPDPKREPATPSLIFAGLMFGIGAVAVVTPAIISLVRSLRQPRVHFHVGTEEVEIREGFTVRRIPFSSISHISTTFHIRPYLRRSEIGVGTIAVILLDGTRLQLGNLSGAVADTQKRLKDIAQLITTTGVREEDQAS